MAAVVAVEMFPLPLRYYWYSVAYHKGVGAFVTVSARRAEALTTDTRNINHLSFLIDREGGCLASQAANIVPMQDGYHRGSGDNL
jgi:hypothetical protein